MDWLDNLIPSGLYSRGVAEFHEDFSGFPGLTSALLIFLLVGFVMLAVSVDSFVISRAGRAIRATV